MCVCSSFKIYFAKKESNKINTRLFYDLLMVVYVKNNYFTRE